MDPAEKPTIDLNFDRVVCARHGEPFRKQWPAGFSEFATSLLEDWVHDSTLDGTEEDARALMTQLDERPLCERVGKAALHFAYLSTEIGVLATCAICGTDKYGTLYTARKPDGALRRYPHICFECVASKLALMN